MAFTKHLNVLFSYEKKFTRKFWIDVLCKIADPVLKNLAEGKLKQEMPKFNEERIQFSAPLEAFGRLFCGMSPWLEFDSPNKEEKNLIQKYRSLFLTCIDNATNEKSPDYMTFDEKATRQPLVDAAFLCHGLLRAPNFTATLPPPGNNN